MDFLTLILLLVFLAVIAPFFKGLLSRLLGRPKITESVVNLRGPETYSVNIVGESQYQSALEAICGGRTSESQEKNTTAVLIHEDINPYDNQAIRVDIEGRTVGYLSRENARVYRERMKEAGYPGITATCSAMIVGGWDRGPDDRGHFGVKLDLPTED